MFRFVCMTVVCSILALITEGFILDSIFGAEPETVHALDLTKYLGRWYQMYASASVDTLWENGAVCVTADYQLQADGGVSVLNSERLTLANGTLKVIHGYATPTAEVGKLTVHLETVPIGAAYGQGPNGSLTVLNSERLKTADGTLKALHGYATTSSEPGKLTVHLEGVPVGAAYWVLKLGPATFGDRGLYQYSVVSDNIRGTLFVLARDPAQFNSELKAEVDRFLKDAGFTHFYNRPVVTYQGNDCVYNTNDM